MKKISKLVVILLLALYCSMIAAIAQSPRMFKYQTIVRDNNGYIVPNLAVAFQISILQGDTSGAVVYRETHHKATNNFGLVNLEIGKGLIDSGSMNIINWANGPYYVKVELDITNGTTFTYMGTSELLSVPYALYAEKAGTISYTETDPIFATHPSHGITLTKITNWTTAFGWGNHAGLYHLNTWLPSWTDITNKPLFWDSSWVSIKNKPNFSTVAISGDYNDLLNRPSLWDSTWLSIKNKPNFAAVAASGNYNDLLNKPTIPVAQVNCDWNSSSGISQILNKPVLFDGTWNSLSGKPSLSTVATSGNYNDLNNIPAPYIAGTGIQITGSSINVNLNLSVSNLGDTLKLTPGNYVIIPGISAYNANVQVISNPIIAGITSTLAICNYTVLSNTYSVIVNRGVCWDTISNPTINGSHTSEAGGTGSFSSNLTGLLSNKVYYVRAYIINSNSTYYGNQTTFTTLSTVATLTTSDTSNVTQSTANCGGNIIYDGGASITEKGVCWSTTTNPTISNNKTSNGSGNGSFTSNLSNLLPNTTYFIRAYAMNSAGSSYGNNVSFTTKGSLPTITTEFVQGITKTEAIPYGNVVTAGSFSVTEKGFCWSSNNTNPTIENNKKSFGNGTGVFNGMLTFLTPNTTFYVRAYATNAQGTSYGNVLTFSTLPAYYEGFESGMPIGWIGNWSLSYSNKYDGYYSLFSDHTNDTISFTRSITAAGQISFWYLATNYNCTYGSSHQDTPTRTDFYIDNEYKTTCTSTSWSIITFPISAGTHTFKWLNRGRAGTQYCWSDGFEGQAWIDYFICSY
jgi:hypothetical protein